MRMTPQLAFKRGLQFGVLIGLLVASMVWLVVGIASGASAQVVGGPGVVDQTTPLTCDNKNLSFHRHRARSILKHEYRVTYYSTHETAERDKIRGYKQHKLCIRHRGIRRDLGKQRKELARFQRARIAATPYAGYGVFWSIPVYVASCESGGGGMPDYTPVGAYPTGGAYGLLQSWAEHGGLKYAGVASDAEPWQQDLVARAAWLHGDSWACA